MAHSEEIVVTLGGGARVEARVGNHVIRTDQPLKNGGEDSAPSPFDLFAASLGTCAGFFVQRFCNQRGLPTEGIRIVERTRFDANGTLCGVDLHLELPPEFPAKYRDAVVRTVEQCSVKRAIQARPELTVRATLAEEEPALV